MDVESLLRRASAAPLGPLVLSFTAAGPDTWTLTVTLGDRTRRVRAEHEKATDGLILACRSKSPDHQGGLSGPWVMDTAAVAGGHTEHRLWLHGDGLTPALLLNALAGLMPLAAAEPGAPDAVVVEAAKITIPTPPEPVGPEPVPVERPRRTPWQSFGFGARQPERSDASAQPEDVAALSSTAATPEAPGESQPAAGPPPVTTEPGPITAITQSSPTAPQPEMAPVAPAPEPPPPAAEPEAPKRAGYCRECGSAYAADHSFCTNCGARLH